MDAQMSQRLRDAWQGTGTPLRRRTILGLSAVILAAVIWVPSLHLLFMPKLDDYFRAEGIPPKARALAKRHLLMWTDPELKAEELRKMRVRNAEWDFMGRTFFALALANMSLREPAEKARYLGVMDQIIEETIRLEEKEGDAFFLLPYGRVGKFSTDPPRSLFVDGEIALMLGARRLVEEREDYKPLLAERVEAMIAYMSESPVLSGESYPSECWMFCNTVALAAIRIHDVLDGTDHSAFLAAWVGTAKRKLMEPTSGLLVSSYRPNGSVLDGPEGSSIWMVAHCLQVVDEEFAKDQYDRARRLLKAEVLGFGYAREWPAGASWAGWADVDSGPVIPILDASPGSSGNAFLGAATFGDEAFLRSLVTSLNFAAFPVQRNGGLKYCAGNQVGDAVILYSTVMGPVWKKVMEVRAR